MAISSVKERNNTGEAGSGGEEAEFKQRSRNTAAQPPERRTDAWQQPVQTATVKEGGTPRGIAGENGVPMRGLYHVNLQFSPRRED